MTTSVKRTLRGAALAFIVCAAWAPAAMADVVELTTGEKIVGVIKDLTSRGLVIEVQGRKRTIPRRLIRSLAFGPARPTRPPSSTAKTPAAVAKPSPATVPAPGKAAPTPANSSTARGRQATAAASDTVTRGKPTAAPKEPASTAQPVETAAGPAKAALAPVTPTAEVLRPAAAPVELTPPPSVAKAETTPPVPPVPAPPTIVIAKLSPATLRDAVQALFDLRAAALPGIGSDDYASRVAQAKPSLDRYLGDSGNAQADVKSALTTAMRLYSFAASAWSVYVDKGDFASVGRDPTIAECPRLQRAIERDAADWKFKADDPAFAGLIAGSEGLPDLWACASDRLVVAEKLLAAQLQ